MGTRWKGMDNRLVKTSGLGGYMQCSDYREFTEKETAMLLYLKEKIKQCGGDDLQFFQCSYIWKFDKFYECVADIAQYRLHGVIPRYVQEYIKHLQQEETCSSKDGNQTGV